MVLPTSLIKIRYKSVKQFLSYDQTYQQTDRKTAITTLYIYIMSSCIILVVLQPCTQPLKAEESSPTLAYQTLSYPPLERTYCNLKRILIVVQQNWDVISCPIKMFYQFVRSCMICVIYLTFTDQKKQFKSRNLEY